MYATFFRGKETVEIVKASKYDATVGGFPSTSNWAQGSRPRIHRRDYISHLAREKGRS